LIESLIIRALERDPGPDYEELSGVGASCFDNLTIRVAYKAYSTQDSTGFRMDMTNWATMTIPRAVATANFDARKICKRFTAVPIVQLVMLSHHAMPARERGALSDDVVEIVVCEPIFLFDRPSYRACWTPCIQTMPAMFGRLISSLLAATASRSIACST